jgi:hypothetical protein
VAWLFYKRRERHKDKVWLYTATVVLWLRKSTREWVRWAWKRTRSLAVAVGEWARSAWERARGTEDETPAPELAGEPQAPPTEPPMRRLAAAKEQAKAALSQGAPIDKPAPQMAAAKEQAKATYTVDRLRSLVADDNPINRGAVLDIVHHWWESGLPMGTGDWTEWSRPSRILDMTAGRYHVDLTVALAAKEGVWEYFNKHAGPAMQLSAGLPPETITVHEVPGKAHTTARIQIRTSKPARPKPLNVSAGGAIMDGVTLALDWLGREVTMPVANAFQLLVGGPGAGKSTTLMTAMLQAQAREDCDVWLIDCTGGIPSMQGKVARYIDNYNEVYALGAEIDALVAQRAAMRKQLGNLNYLPPTEDPKRRHIWIVFDEFPNLLYLAPNRKQFEGQWKNIAKVCRKEGITIAFGSQQGTKEALPKAFIDVCTVVVAQRMTQAESLYVCAPFHVPKAVDASVLEPGTGDALVRVPGHSGFRRCTIIPPPDLTRKAPADPLPMPPAEPLPNAPADALPTQISDSKEGGEGDPSAATDQAAAEIVRRLSESDVPLTVAELADGMPWARDTVDRAARRLKEGGEIVSCLPRRGQPANARPYRLAEAEGAYDALDPVDA